MKTQLAFFTASVLFVFVSCNNQQSTATTEPAAPALSVSETNKLAYREIVRAFETGNTDSLGKYVAENSIDHAPPVPGITSTGLQHLKDIIALYRSAFPDMKFAFHHVVAEGDMLIAHASWSGTNTGPFMGGPATNKSVTGEFIDILRFENGKAMEHWEVSDQIPVLTQLGLMPAQGPAPTPVEHPTYDWNAPVTSDPARVAQMKEAYTAVTGMIQAGDLSGIEQYIAADMVEHAQIPGVTFPAGIEGVKQAMAMYKQAYPDLKMTPEHVVAEGDILIASFTMEGTFSGDIPGLPPTAAGKKVQTKSVDIVQFNAEGKAVAHWEVTDHYTEMIQLGLIPAPATEGQAAAN